MQSETADESWSALNYWELDDFYRDIRATVLELEGAFTSGRLRQLLAVPGLARRVGSGIVSVYERLASTSPGRLHHLRLETVRTLLEHVREEIFEVRMHAHAEVAAAKQVERLDAATGTPTVGRRISTIRARMTGDEAEWELLRLDQALAARYWGIGFQFEDLDTTNEIARQVARATTTRLASDLGNVQRVLRRFRPREPGAPVSVVPKPSERGFERLMLDILNEEEPIARLAPLLEDFLEKTDLRVQYDGLNRNRGGRVQVTQVTDPRRHRDKLDRIRLVDEFVVLSPVTLAHFVKQQVNGADDSSRLLSAQELEGLWGCLPDLPDDVGTLAASLKTVLLRPLVDPRRHARGPMAQVPAALRLIIRRFVRSEVFRSTAVLRQRETASGTRRGRPVGLRPTPDVAQGVASKRRAAITEDDLRRRAAACLALKEGMTVTGTITNVKDYGAFVDIGDVTGLLHVSALALPEGCNPSEHFEIGQRLDVVVQSIDRARQRVSLALPTRQDR